MKVIIESNVLKHKKEYNMEIWENVRHITFEHQPKNGDWIILLFKENTPEYEAFKYQKGTCYIQIDRTADIVNIIQK